MNNNATIKQMLKETMSSDNVNQSTKIFIKSLRRYFKKEDKLSDRQLTALTEIYNSI